MSIDISPKSTVSFSEQVAEEIRALLARRRIRQSQLARELGVSEQWISVRLRGVQPIDLNDLARIATVLGVAIADLLPPSAEQANRPTGQTDSDGTARTEASVRNVAVPERSARAGYPDRVRPRDARPSGHPKHSAPPPAHRRPVRAPRAA